MNPTELKVARVRRHIAGRNAAKALCLSMDGYYKKEHGEARVTLSDAFTLTKFYGLTLTEFVAIFFDGDLPFLQDSNRNCQFGERAFPLREARLEAGLTVEQVAANLGIGVDCYIKREKGRVRITLEQCAAISKMCGLSLDEFNDVFFRSKLPYRKEDLLDYKPIVPQKGGEVNAETGN